MKAQPGLLSWLPPPGDRGGHTYERARDGKRLNAQAEAVWQVMRDRQWHTLEEIAEKARCPQASASARLRDLRKARFGSRIVDREYVGNGLWRYRIADALVGESA